MGANPSVKDIFIQLDWMAAAGHNHQPKQAALNKVIAAFAAAPGGAINVHFDTGQGGAFTGGGHVIPEVTPTAWKKDFTTVSAMEINPLATPADAAALDFDRDLAFPGSLRSRRQAWPVGRNTFEGS